MRKGLKRKKTEPGKIFLKVTAWDGKARMGCGRYEMPPKAGVPGKWMRVPKERSRGERWSPVTGFRLPNTSLLVDKPLKLCLRGFHVTDVDHVGEWLGNSTDRLFLAEIGRERVGRFHLHKKIAARKMRLLEEVPKRVRRKRSSYGGYCINFEGLQAFLTERAPVWARRKAAARARQKTRKGGK